MAFSKMQRDQREILEEIGQYIYEYRSKKGLSLQQMSVRVGVNPSYLREVEQGKRIPDDQFIRNLSESYNFDENYIFMLLGKCPLKAREELEEHIILQETLKEIAMSNFSFQEREEIYRKFYSITKTALLKAPMAHY